MHMKNQITKKNSSTKKKNGLLREREQQTKRKYDLLVLGKGTDCGIF